MQDICVMIFFPLFTHIKRQIMIEIDYKNLLTQHKPNHYVSSRANLIANTVINEMHIQYNYGLAPFLGLKGSINNHTAVRVWVQRQLDMQAYEISDDEIVSQLKRMLADLCALENLSVL